MEIGIIRQLDALGRICLPKEMRRYLNVGECDELNILVSDGAFIIRPVHKECVFCGTRYNLQQVMDKPVCVDCISKIPLEQR